jgi:hypothetical protein
VWHAVWQQSLQAASSTTLDSSHHVRALQNHRSSPCCVAAGFDGGKVFGTLLGASFLLAADQVRSTAAAAAAAGGDRFTSPARLLSQ